MIATAASADRCATVHVIVTCTNRKTAAAPPQLQLGNLPGRPINELVRSWIARLRDPSGPQPLAAIDLYGGEHWAIARQLPDSVTAQKVRLWVCSAGYGLIRASASIRPYSAAFSGQGDRVPGGADGARRWWQALADWEGPEPGQPRSIRDLAAANPAAMFMLALSAPYLEACRDDIACAARVLLDQDQLLVISAGARGLNGLTGLMVPADARLQAVLGGTRQALNARTARCLLEVGIRGCGEAVGHMTGLLAEQPPVRRYERKRLGDGEVKQMIAARLTVDPRTSASRMLRDFRDAGWACEQQRFAALHRQVAGDAR